MKCYVCGTDYFRQTEVEPEERCMCNLDLPEHFYSEFSWKEKIKVQYLRFLFWLIGTIGLQLVDRLDKYAMKKAKEL